MRWLPALFLGLCLLGEAPRCGAQNAAPRGSVSFDGGWRFLKSDARGAEKPAFNDAAWRALSLPHDWSIEGPFAERNNTGASGAFLPAGVGWYRKRFTLPAGDAQRALFLEFDGVMTRCEVWINGVSLGARPDGRFSFRCELTGRLEFGPGKTNVVAVRVDDSRQPAARYYTGAGIARHVRLTVADPVHIDLWGPRVLTPSVNADRAVVRLQTVVTNQSRFPREIALAHNLFGPSGEIVQSAESKPMVLPPFRSVEITQDVAVLKPALWDVDHPNLYRIRSTLKSGGAALDGVFTTFGIREARFEPLTGFFLNGRSVKLKGVCLHQDGGAFGVAVPARVWEQRLGQLKSLGCNAIRTTHEPPAPEFLDLCDRMGFLVVDEFFDGWSVGKMPYDYHLAFKDWARGDLGNAIGRDRNHPSIIAYSVGNEPRDTRDPSLARKNLAMLLEVCRQMDPTRPVTAALARSDATKDFKNGFADMLDIIGQNYHESDLVASFAAKPTRRILQTESGPDRAAWILIRDNAFCPGQFLWTGVDYLGDGQKWPWIGCGSGLLDRTGFARPQAYERKALWTEVPLVRIVRRPGGPVPVPKGGTNSVKIDSARFDAPNQRPVAVSDWTPRNMGPHKETVEVYGNCQDIELFLNGKSLGVKPRAGDEEPRVWQVPYEPGVLRAIGMSDGLPVAGHELKTAGPPAAIALTADLNSLPFDWDQVACARAQIVDAAGTPIPEAADLIRFKVTGPGTIVATDSGANWSHESFQTAEHKAFNGQCAAYVRASAPTGRILVTATVAGLAPATVSLNASAK